MYAVHLVRFMKLRKPILTIVVGDRLPVVTHVVIAVLLIMAHRHLQRWGSRVVRFERVVKGTTIVTNLSGVREVALEAREISIERIEPASEGRLKREEKGGCLYEPAASEVEMGAVREVVVSLMCDGAETGVGAT